MPTQTGSLDLKASKAAHMEASKTATNYITYIDSENGIRVSDGQAENENVNFAQINSGGMQIYNNGEVAAAYGEAATIGKAGGYRTVITNGNFQIGNSAGQILSIADTGATRPSNVIALSVPYTHQKLVNDQGESAPISRVTFYSFVFPIDTMLTINLIFNSGVVASGTYISSEGNVTKTVAYGDRYGRTFNGLTDATIEYHVNSDNTVFASVTHRVTQQVSAYTTISSILCGLEITYPSTIDVPQMNFIGDLAISDRSGTLKSIFDLFYPVGSYYETSDASFDPNNVWLGTWEQDSAGRVTVGYSSGETEFNTIGKTGGSKYIQAHTHSFTNPSVQYNVVYRQSVSSGGGVRNCVSGGTGGSFQTINGSVGAVSGATTGTSGNLQPYVTVYRWHRTA